MKQYSIKMPKNSVINYIVFKDEMPDYIKNNEKSLMNRIRD